MGLIDHTSYISQHRYYLLSVSRHTFSILLAVALDYELGKVEAMFMIAWHCPEIDAYCW